MSEERKHVMEKIDPVVHGMAMYEVFLKHDKMTHDQALFRALCCAVLEARGRCEEACEETAERLPKEFKDRPDMFRESLYLREGAQKAAEAIRKLPPPNMDKDGILR